jgi:hypothetical protein
MISNNIEIMFTLQALLTSQLINNTCQLKGVYNQACLVWQVCLFILVITSKWNPCVCVCLCVSMCVAAGGDIDTDIFTTYLLTPSVWNDWVRLPAMIRIWGHFKPILDLDLYGEHMREERITGSKIYLDLSPGSTNMRVYTVVILTSLI